MSASGFTSRHLILLAGLGLLGGVIFFASRGNSPSSLLDSGPTGTSTSSLVYQPRRYLDTSGFSLMSSVTVWEPDDSLNEIARAWDQGALRQKELLDIQLASPLLPDDVRLELTATKAALENFDGHPEVAYQTLSELRRQIESRPDLAAPWLYTIIFFQGVTSMRQGENDNCILCRGERSCILPFHPEAVHQHRQGSEQAIVHFTEYLEMFPDDLSVQWLLNLAHMTLGDYPHRVDSRHLISLDNWGESEFNVGEFRDVAHLAGVNRFNQSGGAIMEDFNQDGLLDLVVTSYDPGLRTEVYLNRGDGTFAMVTEEARVTDQLGGLYCVQADFNHDGLIDVFIPRGAWQSIPMRPTLLENMGDGTFVDVTEAAGLMAPACSNSASWGDFDLDGHLDLFLCCENSPNRLYRSRGDGTFEDVAAAAGVTGPVENFCKGAAWIDIDNDRFPDLFQNDLKGQSRLYLNQRDGTFRDVSLEWGIDGPQRGFSCWAWDYDNDGWLDLFATSYDLTLGDIVLGLTGQQHHRDSNRLYHNEGGRRFSNQTAAAGLDLVFATMGSNFGDFDNDGFLDFYLGTGDPDLGTLIPNRLFRNVDGIRFSDVSAVSRTGHLQKGHAVSWADWNRDGYLDLFIQMGGATPGDQFHNILFQNPGTGGNSITLRFIGRGCDRSALGTRIRARIGEREIHRHVTSGSSFGANPLEVTIGLGAAPGLDELVLEWPASALVQTFQNLAAGSCVLIREGDDAVWSLPVR